MAESKLRTLSVDFAVSANHYNQRGKEKFYGKSFPHVYGGGKYV